MTEIQRMLQEARPKLRAANPIVYWISWGFVVFNVLIGIYMLAQEAPAFRAIPVTGLLDVRLWAAIFISLSIPLSVGLVRNDWRMIRGAMIAGLFIKAFWSYALIFIALQAGVIDTLASMAMWFLIAFIQAVAVIYFIPKEPMRILKHNGKSNL